MVAARFDKKMKQGKISGFNLSFEKVDLTSSIGYLAQQLAKTTDPHLRSEYHHSLAALKAKLEKVEEALREENEKDKTTKLEDLEKRQEAE